MPRITVLHRLPNGTHVDEQVRRALVQGDNEHAIILTGQYLRQRKIAHKLWEIKQSVPISDDLRLADAATKGIIEEYGRADFSNGIPWFGAPMTTVSRFPHMEPLLRAWKSTGNEIYAETALQDIRDYIDHVPISLARSTNEKSWHANPWHWCFLAPRVVRFINAARCLENYAGFTDEDMVSIVSTVIDEVDFGYPQMNMGMHANPTFSQIKYVIYAALFLPEITGTDIWMRDAITLWEEFARTYYYPDGAAKELALGYATSVTRQMNDVYEAVVDLPQAKGVGEILTSANRFYMSIVSPDRMVPPYGDNQFGDVTDALAPAARDLFNLGELADAITDRTGNSSPGFRSWPAASDDDCWGGIYAMRGDWSENSNYLAFDCGPWGSNHQHADFMSFHLYAFGRPIVVDPGTCSYHTVEHKGKSIELSHGFQHNTITIDGVDQGAGQAEDIAPVPMQHRWITHSQLDTVDATYDFWQHDVDVQHQRRITFAAPDYWLLLDRLTGALDVQHSLEQNFQCESHCTVEKGENKNGEGHVIIQGMDGRGLHIIPVEGKRPFKVITGEKKRPLNPTYDRARVGSVDWVSGGRGWNGVDFTNHEWLEIAAPAPALVYTFDFECPLTLATVLLPTMHGREPDVSVISTPAENQTADTGLVIDINLTENGVSRRDLWIVSYAAHPLTFDHASFSALHGEFVFLRDVDGKEPSAHIVNSGAARFTLADRPFSMFVDQRTDMHIQLAGDQLEVFTNPSNKGPRIISELAWGERSFSGVRLLPGKKVVL